VSEADRNRLVACRACGNRVAREARRCPACGAREPTAAGADPLAAPSAARGEQADPPQRAAQRRRRTLVAMLGMLFVLSAAGVTAVYLTMPPVAPPSQSPAQAAPAPVAVAPSGEPAVPGPQVASRSRGRADWLFFFRPGDWLTRMTDEALLGVVVRVESAHTFADGSSGPAYVVQSMEGEERVLDADELERSARLR
jgi:hypothetical protein